MSHTPGPWSVHPDDPAYGSRAGTLVWGPQGPGHGVIAKCRYLGRLVENEANARLIAAAPDLLEVVAGFLLEFGSVQWVTPEPKLVKAGKAAFEKATGKALYS